ncbi:MAG TPA: hypothetical protein VGR14_13325 [Verrucomicrobiae bacterium]|jgi:hypothetical protein|nr:hypothetical protein [Verrucomicrobiae bacterium]
MEFLKKHYEKIVLCVVLLGLAGAVLWMKSALEKVREELATTAAAPTPKTTPPTPMDLTNYQQALAQITNPPAVVLSGDHNLFNPVTWKRYGNGELKKVLKTGPDALIVTNIIPLYTIISYESTSPGTSVYLMGVETNVDLRKPNPRKHIDHAHKGEKMKSGLYTVLGIKGAEDDPSEINLEIIQTGETNVWVSTNTPYKRADSFLADLKYDPDPTLALQKKRVNDEFKLDNEPYIIVEITNDVVRVKSRRTTKVTELKWIPSRNGD